MERIKRGRLQLAFEPVEVCPSIEEAADALRGQLDGAGLRLELDLPGQDLVVRADPERLVQMVDNLLRNAINYTDGGGLIRVKARRKDSRAVITVEDSGIGIDPAEAADLFEPYYQGRQGRQVKGLGLGLTLVKRLVEMHNGTVSVHSDGSGAVAYSAAAARDAARELNPQVAFLDRSDTGTIAELLSELSRSIRPRAERAN